MTDDVMATVERYKELAKHYKNQAERTNQNGDYQESVLKLERSLAYLEKSINLLLPRYGKAVENSDKDTLSRELADCYGMMGGIYRRRALLENRREYLLKSAEMYDTGLKYEIDDSYNRFNSVVIQILLDPANFEKQKSEIEKCIEIIQKQIKGARRDQWWAWADLGLFNLLLGREEVAISAYQVFSRGGTNAQSYESVLSVLNSLEEALRTSSSSKAQSVAQSMRVIIKMLEKEKPR